MYLARYHDVTISTSGVWRILKRLGMNRLPASQRYQRRSAAVEALREATPRPPAASRREVHRTTRPDRPPAASTTSSPPSTTAPGYECCAPIPAATRKPPSRSSTTSCPSCRSPSSGCKPTTDPNSAHRSTGTCSTKASTTSGSNPARHGSTARWRDPTASTPKSSTDSSKAKSSTTPDLFSDKLQEWEDYYNYHRPHGALSGQTPYERLRQKAQDPLS